MHYITARKLLCSIPYNWIDSLERGDVGLSSYKVKTGFGYEIHLIPLFNWIHIYKDGKQIGRLTDKAHFAYLRDFMRKIYLAIHQGAKCTDWIKECFIEDLNELKPYR